MTKTKKTHSEIPLCQRLLAALITEEGNEEEPCCSGSEDLNFDVYDGSGVDELDTDMEASAYNHQSLKKTFELSGRASFNGYKITATRRSSFNEMERHLADNDINGGITSSFDHSQNDSLPGYSGVQYGSMSVDERLLLEIQSIGLYPEPVVGSLSLSLSLSQCSEKC